MSYRISDNSNSHKNTTNNLRSYQFTGNLIPNNWYRKLTTKSDRPDLASISVLSEILYWYRPNRGGGSKFNGDAWQTSYEHFSAKFGYNRETLRRIFVKLEGLGLIQRELRTLKSYGQKYNNVLFIHLNNQQLLDLTEIDNKKICASNQKLYTPSPQIVGDHIEEENKLKNIESRSSISDLCSNNFFEGQLTNTTHNQDIDPESYVPEPLVKTPDNQKGTAKEFEKPYSCSHETVIQKLNTGIRVRQPMLNFHPLSEEDAIFLRKESQRKFDLHYINKLLLRLSEEYPNHGFYTRSLLLSYLCEALKKEKYDTTIANSESFYFKPKEGSIKARNLQMSNYLRIIEESRQVDAITRIKQRIIGLSSGDDEYAYHILKNCTLPYLQYDHISANHLKKTSTSFLIKIDISITQDQIRIITKATKEVLGQSIEISFKNKETNPKESTDSSSLEPAVKSSPLWQIIRNSLKQRFGESIDKSWFSKLDIELKTGSDTKKKTSTDSAVKSDKDRSTGPDTSSSSLQNQIIIKCPSPFIRDWIKTNYDSAIEEAIKGLGETKLNNNILKEKGENAESLFALSLGNIQRSRFEYVAG